MRKCPYCAEEIQDEAIVCRYCGRDLRAPSKPVQQVEAPQAKKQPYALIGVLLFIAICYLAAQTTSANSPRPTPSVISTGKSTVAPVVIASFTPKPQPTITPAPTKPATYSVGDVVQLKDHTIVLNSASFDNNILKANFTVENTGREPIGISSVADFHVKDAEGINMDQKWFDCGTSFDGSVIVGDRLKGDVCWSLLEAKAVPFKIYYQPNMFNADVTIVWVVAP